MSRKRSLSSVDAPASSASSGGVSSSLASLSVPTPTPTRANNPKGYRVGSIVRVKMVNFMIYNDEEVRPGPGLNLLLGPNGSGKSTVVSAIGIALAGEAKSVGRFDDLKGYVKATSDQSVVEVELFGGSRDGRHNLIISRHFKKDGTSKFYKGHDAHSMHAVQKKDVQAEMSRLNIQVDNLTVYLAQFRVGEFAEMSPAELLAETEKAADPKLHTQHVQLLADTASLRSRVEAAATSRKQTDSLLSEVRSMEGEMKAQEERADTESRIDLIKKRVPWCRVDAASKEVDRHRALKVAAKKDLDDEKARHAPLQAALKKKEAELAKAKHALTQIQSTIEEKRGVRAKSHADMGRCQQAIDSAEAALQDIDRDEARQQAKLEEERSNLRQHESELSQLRPVADIAAEQDVVERRLRSLRTAVTERGRQQSDMTNSLHEAMGNKRSTENRLANLKNKPVITPLVRMMRTVKDRATCEREQMAVERLRAERKLRAAAHGPLISLLNVADPKCASFVETVITRKFWSAYVVENEHDWKTLRDAGVRTVIHAPPFTEPKRQYDLTPLRKFGVRYLDEAIECADIVRSAIYDTFQLANLLYTDRDLTQSELGQIVSSRRNDHKLQNLFMPKSQYSTAVSKWTEDVAVRINNNIRPAQVLGGAFTNPHAKAIGEAQVELDKIIVEIDALQRRKSEMIDEHNRETEKERKSKEEGNVKLSSLQSERKLRSQVQSRIDTCRQRIGDLERRPDGRAKKRELEKRIKDFEDKRIAATEEIMSLELSLAHFNEFTTSTEYQHLKARLESASSSNRRLQRALEAAQDAYVRSRQDLDSRTQDATRRARREEFDGLEWMPRDLSEEQAKAMLDELTLSLSRSIVDVSIKDRFERTSQQLKEAQLRSDLDESQVKDIERRIQQTKEIWLNKVQQMVKTIDEMFALYFDRIGCKGRVELSTENDVYGILIKVSFRNNVPLQSLSASSQSGGEKSVSTMLYLLCLQEVTDTPFRMADEINQGMDAKNERTVFDQIVRSCQPRQRSRAEERKEDDADEEPDKEPPQYFVVTPKLLPNLQFSDRVAIFNVYNGSHMVPQSEWDLGRFMRIGTSGHVKEVQNARKKQRREAAAAAAAAEAEAE